jgi:hypothetical protein
MAQIDPQPFYLASDPVARIFLQLMLMRLRSPSSPFLRKLGRIGTAPLRCEASTKLLSSDMSQLILSVGC